ncbi:MAG: beta-aspartyl-peptidase [Planctomycetota bacterium]
MFTLFENANVYAPEPLGVKNVLVADRRIAWIGDGPLDLDAQLDVTRVDVGGDALIPGLIDGHAHITGGGGEAGYGSSVPPQEAEVFLSAGVTSVVGLLGTDDCVRTTDQLVHTAYGLRAHGLSAWCYTGGYHLPPMTLTGSIRRDIVHLDPVIGFGELAISDHRSSQPTRDEVLRVASEVHVAGLMTGKAGIVHFHLGDGERGLALIRECLDSSEIPARVFHPTHVNRRAALFEEALAITERGVVIDITATPEEGPGMDEVPASRAVAAILDSNIDRTRWTVSSDGGGCLPAFNEQGEVVGVDVGRPVTLWKLIATLLADHPLEEILPGFTSNPASLLRLHHKGRIEVGADADLNLIRDQRIVATYAGGRAR